MTTQSAMPETTMPQRASRKSDATLAAAVDVARAALVESVRESDVGDHLTTIAEGDRVLTHLFVCTQRGYDGWRWAVTVTRAPRHKQVTVNEVTLVPSDSALVAPTWLPWKDRVGKDDLGPGDLNPRPTIDPRLVPGYLVGDESLDETTAREQRDIAREVGLGRELVLSIEGRDAAAERWYAGDHGPDTAMAKAAPAHCMSCGFLVRVSGPLARVFGACANASSSSDGHVVALDHGCGAHSDVIEEQTSRQAAAPDRPTFDTLTWDAFTDSDLEIISR